MWWVCSSDAVSGADTRRRGLNEHFQLGTGKRNSLSTPQHLPPLPYPGLSAPEVSALDALPGSGTLSPMPHKRLQRTSLCPLGREADPAQSHQRSSTRDVEWRRRSLQACRLVPSTGESSSPSPFFHCNTQKHHSLDVLSLRQASTEIRIQLLIASPSYFCACSRRWTWSRSASPEDARLPRHLPPPRPPQSHHSAPPPALHPPQSPPPQNW